MHLNRGTNNLIRNAIQILIHAISTLHRRVFFVISVLSVVIPFP